MSSRRRLLPILASMALAAVVCTRPASAAPPVSVQTARITVAGERVTAPSDKGTAVLTLDPQLQQDVATLLAQSRAPIAAAIVIDVRTGRILAWASRDQARGLDMVSRPFAPPASLFKVVTATALLEEAKVPTTARQCYVGGQRNVRLQDLRDNGAGQGVQCTTFATALGYSRNLVMAGLANRHLKAQQLRDTARELGLTGPLPIDVDVSNGQPVVPSTDVGMARAAAGFGAGTLTPLSAAYMMTLIANGGRHRPLSLIDHLEAPDGARLAPPRATAPNQVAMSAATARTLTRMLEVTVREGTAARAFRDGQGGRFLGRLGGVGKTGTLSRGNPTRLFSWYAGFAPADRPQIAIAVLLANDLKWWRKANEVGRDVLRAYFARRNTSGVTHPLPQRTARRRSVKRR